MLTGLCKKLRVQGVDAIAIENFESLDRLGQVGKEQNRKVISKGAKRVIRLRQMVPKGWVMDLKTDKPEDQIEEIFAFFNVVTDPEDLFSRCSICNGNEYLTINSRQLKSLKESILKFESSTRNCALPDGFDDEDDDEGIISSLI